MNSGAPMGYWSTRAKVIRAGTGDWEGLWGLESWGCCVWGGGWRGQVVFSPTLVVGCLEAKCQCRGCPWLSLAVLGATVTLLTCGILSIGDLLKQILIFTPAG